MKCTLIKSESMNFEIISAITQIESIVDGNSIDELKHLLNISGHKTSEVLKPGSSMTQFAETSEVSPID
jgi:hypothetical protein